MSPDWDKIRADWKRSGASDAQLAKAWGFKSPTSIERRRKREGWTRDLKDASDHVVTETVRAEQEDVGGVGDTHTAHIAGPTPPANESRDLAAPTRLGVGDQRHDLPADAPEAAKPHTNVGDYRVTAYEARVEATRRQLALSDGMQRVAEIYSQLLIDSASNNWLIAELARKKMSGVNPDKETLKGLIGALAQLAVVSTKIQREALGMDLKAEEDPGSAQPSAMSMEKLLDELDEDVLERLRDATIKVRLAALRDQQPGAPTIEHQPHQERSS